METVYTLVPPPGKTSTALWIPVVLVLLISFVGIFFVYKSLSGACQRRHAGEHAEQDLEARHLGSGGQGFQQLKGLLQGHGQHQIPAAEGVARCGFQGEACLIRQDARHPSLQSHIQARGQMLGEGVQAPRMEGSPLISRKGIGLAGLPLALEMPGPLGGQDHPLHLAKCRQKGGVTAVKEQGAEIDGLPLMAPRGQAPTHASGALQHYHVAA